ncbi:MAG: insulinase family protein [Schwartzia sp.]|nr:insulinase family protein [Schwartzia sp. (in: firmicutes)]
MKVNDVIHGFRLKKTRPIPEVDSVSFEFLHEKSGARLFYLQNDDDNKVFFIGFRTPPSDDTGVPHIIEHSVLCGSRKFPLKEPFVELVKGSLNTFLNAMTYPDKTVYPVASRNDKDFQNLMDVYLDAVFYPVLHQKPEILMQEGWHYEVESPEQPLQYSGVVYNEMKGATSSPEDLLETAVLKSLYPDTTYHFESGGNPERIPDLTMEKFTGFHKKYYHPSNSYIYLYGDLDIEEKLAFLDQAYLSAFSKANVDSTIDNQKPFDGLRRIRERYPVGADEDEKGKTYLSWNLVVDDGGEQLTRVALAVLVHALFTTDAAPVRQALLDAGIGKDMMAFLENDLCQPHFSVEVTNAEAEDEDRFHEVCRGTLEKLANQGIDQMLLEASLNIMEFKLREADFNQTPKGLVYGLGVMSRWLYDRDPAEALFYEDILKTLREGLDNGFYEKVLRQFLLENPHQTLVTMVPDRTMAAAREAETEKRLAAKKAAMTPAEVEEVVTMTARLKEMQAAPDRPEDLAKIPLLALSDIRREAEELPLEERSLAGQTILYSDISTHGIAYLNLYFDADVLTPEEQLYAYFLCDILGAVDTDRHSYSELTTLKNLHTGGISFDLGTQSQYKDETIWHAKGVIKARVLVRKAGELCALLAEILTASQFTDRKRMKELTDQCLAGCEREIMNLPQQVMARRLGSYISPAARFDARGDLPYYDFIKELSRRFDEQIEAASEKLTAVMGKLFRRQGLVLGLTTAAADYEAVAGPLTDFLTALPETEWPAVAKPVAYTKNEGLATSSRVQYVGKGANFRQLGFPLTGSMRVLETIMRYGYLWTKVRVQGGAYGASAQFTNDGRMLFTSYRDPNLAETLAVYDQVPEYLAGFDASEREMTKYIIGTMSVLDMPLTPQMKGSIALIRHMCGITLADRQRLRDEILSTGVKEIRALAEVVAAGLREDTFCVFGNEEKLRENAGRFSHILQVME